MPISIEEHAAIAAEQGVPAEVIELLSRSSTRSWTAERPRDRRGAPRPGPRAPGLQRLRARGRGERRLERAGGGREELTRALGHDRLIWRSWPGAAIFAAAAAILAVAAPNAMAGQFASEGFGLPAPPAPESALARQRVPSRRVGEPCETTCHRGLADHDFAPPRYKSRAFTSLVHESLCVTVGVTAPTCQGPDRTGDERDLLAG